MRQLTNLAFDNTYARLNPVFSEVVDPTPLPDPRLVAFNPDAAALLDLDPAATADPDLPLYLSGGKRLPGSEPIAEAYAGHQFGVWVPQLGDGRAFLLGEVVNARGERWDLHLKGGGKTRFSRFGDGRAVLRSVIREYLASEALYGLGIPTSRALSIVGSSEPVRRERVETAATLIRLAPTHVRFGTFEFFASTGKPDRIRELADYVVGRHFPEIEAREDRLCSLFGAVCRRTALLMAQWMAAGFAHGVMNTDNMSIIGITLDYGPYGFLDEYDPGFICNHTDAQGRYAFDQQPAIGIWNCARLGEALLAGVEEEGNLSAWQAELDSYWDAFGAEYARLMCAKLGFATAQEDDAALLRELLAILARERVDYTRFFRALSGFPGGDLPAGAELEAWQARYAARLSREHSNDTERGERMRRVNPKFVLRNWVAQEAIERAESGDYGVIEDVRRVMATPYDEHPEMERLGDPPAGAAREISVSCSS